jgi:dTDP-4-dehydrorhamnose reductase
MRALILGASGQVGAALAEQLTARGHQWIGTYAHMPRPGLLPLDITDADATRRLVDQTAPDWVFCASALTHVDYCEEHPEEAFRLNRDAPALVGRAAAHRGAGIVFYSTEYVFDGEGGPYAEDSPVQPISVYGRSKLEGERAVCEANSRAAIVRTTVVYGPEPQGKNFVYQLLRRGRAGQRMKAPHDQISSPTYNADLAAASVELTERGLGGVYHVAGPEALDRHAFARLACRVFGLDEALLDPVTTSALGQRAARPLRAGLRIDRARALLASPLRGPAEGLRAMREAIGEGGEPVREVAKPRAR